MRFLALHLRSMSSLKIVHTALAPKAIGPYSQAIVANGLVFVSGQIPADPATGDIVSQDIQEQTRSSLSNLQAILEASNSSLDKVVKTTVFLKNMSDFQAVNEVYAQVFGEHKPTRATVEVARLPRDVKVEIECVALSLQSTL